MPHTAELEAHFAGCPVGLFTESKVKEYCKRQCVAAGADGAAAGAGATQGEGGADGDGAEAGQEGAAAQEDAELAPLRTRLAALKTAAAPFLPPAAGGMPLQLILSDADAELARPHFEEATALRTAGQRLQDSQLADDAKDVEAGLAARAYGFAQWANDFSDLPKPTVCSVVVVPLSHTLLRARSSHAADKPA